jgi:hypothetical protein
MEPLRSHRSSMFLGLSFAVVACGAPSCAGERLPAASARPEGTRWFCAKGGFSACGRSSVACSAENGRIGSRVVNPGDPPKDGDCEEQDTAVCFTYFSPTKGKQMFDCFRDRIECEGYLKEASRSEANYKDLSVCGTWD